MPENSNENSILIADDRAADIHALKRIIEESRILNPIQTVPDGGEVIAYLSGAGKYADRSVYPFPALLFLDLVMPVKSGIDVLDWIRSPEAELKPLAIVAATYLGNVDEIRQAYQRGAHSFMIKPYSAEDLMNLLKGFVGFRMELKGKDYLLHVDRRLFKRRS